MVETDGGMTLQELNNLIKKNIKIVIVVPIICLAVAAIYAFGIVRLQYTATASLNAPAQLANVNAYLTSSDTRATVADKLGLPDLSGYKISSAVVTTSNTATVTVVGQNASEAAQIANYLVDEAIKSAKERIDVTAVSVSSADAAALKASPNRTMYLVAGLLGGLVVAVFFVVIKEMLRVSFASPKELEETLNIPVLATLQKDNKKNSSCKDWLRNGALQLATNTRFYLENSAKTSVAVVSAGRNNDQAATSVELAIALADQDRRIVLVDADMAKRPIETMLPYVKKPKTPFSAYLGAAGVNINDIIGHSDISNLDIVYADSGIPNASLVCSSRPFKKLVEELSAAYDCVVINAPIDMIDDTVKVASFADAALLVTACGGARRSDVVGLCQSLSDENVNVIGSVLTQVKKQAATGTQPEIQASAEKPEPAALKNANSSGIHAREE